MDRSWASIVFIAPFSRRNSTTGRWFRFAAQCRAVLNQTKFFSFLSSISFFLTIHSSHFDCWRSNLHFRREELLFDSNRPVTLILLETLHQNEWKSSLSFFSVELVFIFNIDVEFRFLSTNQIPDRNLQKSSFLVQNSGIIVVVEKSFRFRLSDVRRLFDEFLLTIGIGLERLDKVHDRRKILFVFHGRCSPDFCLLIMPRFRCRCWLSC